MPLIQTVETAAAQALEYDDVFIARTFSKGYGMAGLRLGYAAGRPATLAKLNAAWGVGSVNVLTATAAIASLNDPDRMLNEREENRRDAGFHNQCVQGDGLRDNRLANQFPVRECAPTGC